MEFIAVVRHLGATELPNFTSKFTPARLTNSRKLQIDPCRRDVLTQRGSSDWDGFSEYLKLRAERLRIDESTGTTNGRSHHLYTAWTEIIDQE